MLLRSAQVENLCYGEAGLAEVVSALAPDAPHLGEALDAEVVVVGESLQQQSFDVGVGRLERGRQPVGPLARRAVGSQPIDAARGIDAPECLRVEAAPEECDVANVAVFFAGLVGLRMARGLEEERGDVGDRRDAVSIRRNRTSSSDT